MANETVKLTSISDDSVIKDRDEVWKSNYIKILR